MMMLRFRFFLERWRERRAASKVAARVDRMLIDRYGYTEIAPGRLEKLI